jgi:hypothetical protein
MDPEHLQIFNKGLSDSHALLKQILHTDESPRRLSVDILLLDLSKYLLNYNLRDFLLIELAMLND